MILFFSGTGNTRYCAELLAKALGDKAFDISPRRRDESISHVAASSRIVWMFPIYSWGVPPIVVDFMRHAVIDGASEVPHYMVATCGDDAGNAAKMWRSLVSDCKWTPRSAYTVQMPNTYVCLPGFDVDSDELQRAKIAAAPAHIAIIAAAIMQDDLSATPRDMVTRGRFARLKTSVIYPSFKHNGVKPQRFAVSDACTGCGTCMRTCPMYNISMKDGKPLWGNNCAMCLACSHRCPAHAVMYGHTTRHKGQYRGPETT